MQTLTDSIVVPLFEAARDAARLEEGKRAKARADVGKYNQAITVTHREFQINRKLGMWPSMAKEIAEEFASEETGVDCRNLIEVDPAADDTHDIFDPRHDCSPWWVCEDLKH